MRRPVLSGTAATLPRRRASTRPLPHPAHLLGMSSSLRIRRSKARRSGLPNWPDPWSSSTENCTLGRAGAPSQCGTAVGCIVRCSLSGCHRMQASWGRGGMLWCSAPQPLHLQHHQVHVLGQEGGPAHGEEGGGGASKCAVPQLVALVGEGCGDPLKGRGGGQAGWREQGRWGPALRAAGACGSSPGCPQCMPSVAPTHPCPPTPQNRA